MPSYYNIRVVRSDGQAAVKRKDGTFESNQPTDDQQSQKVKKEKSADFYRKVEPGGSKDIEWRRKLGGMLMHLSGSPEQLKKAWILECLPENYTLWEHVKHAVDSNGQAKRSESTHAAEGMERQDAYLYGHPQGRKKRYRSPAEFFEHLIWLAADPTGNPKNCVCKICTPLTAGEASEKPTGRASIDISMPEISYQDANRPSNSALTATSIPPSRTPTTKGTSVPAPRSREQTRDRDANSVWLYRLGELVWYSKGTAWGLAVIAKRQELNGKPRYLLQPLSNPLRHAKAVIKNEEDEMRPWLAWSVPNTTHQALTNYSFETVPWDAVLRGDFGTGGNRDADVDGSILASKDIDISYSFFGRIESPVPGENRWNAMFLGAEKIWVGEPVRFQMRLPQASMNQLNPDLHVLIVHQMIEKTTPPPGNTSAPSNSTASQVTIVGDIYKFTITREKPADLYSPNLPIRMTADLRFRNEAARAAGRQEFYSWTLIQASYRQSINDIQGRWYETKKLLPTLRGPETFHKELAQGITLDVAKLMNNRGDCTDFNGGKRRKNRRDTLGKSVPENFAISKGADAVDAKGMAYDDNLFEDDMEGGQDRFDGPAGDEPNLGLDAVEPDLDQFMNLDDAGVGFYGDAM